jgi:hypothetical protein
MTRNKAALSFFDVDHVFSVLLSLMARSPPVNALNELADKLYIAASFIGQNTIFGLQTPPDGIFYWFSTTGRLFSAI